MTRPRLTDDEAWKNRFTIARENLARTGLLPVAQRICAQHRVTLTQVLGGDRRTNRVQARRELWNTLRDTMLLSYPEIGSLTGHHHSTVIEGIKARQADLAREYAA